MRRDFDCELRRLAGRELAACALRVSLDRRSRPELDELQNWRTTELDDLDEAPLEVEAQELAEHVRLRLAVIIGRRPIIINGARHEEDLFPARSKVLVARRRLLAAARTRRRLRTMSNGRRSAQMMMSADVANGAKPHLRLLAAPRAPLYIEFIYFQVHAPPPRDFEYVLEQS